VSRSVRLTYQTAVVLLAVARGLRYGFDIIDASGLKSGTVYPVLRRLEDAGLLRSRWERVQAARDEQRPPRRYYEITGAGAEALREALARDPDVARALARPRPAGTPRPSPA
jgi:PadR family transcriptional regulator PadR